MVADSGRPLTTECAVRRTDRQKRRVLPDEHKEQPSTEPNRRRFWPGDKSRPVNKSSSGRRDPAARQSAGTHHEEKRRQESLRKS